MYALVLFNLNNAPFFLVTKQFVLVLIASRYNDKICHRYCPGMKTLMLYMTCLSLLSQDVVTLHTIVK